jgi:ADP-ribose pyrophosphatase
MTAKKSTRTSGTSNSGTGNEALKDGAPEEKAVTVSEPSNSEPPKESGKAVKSKTTAKTAAGSAKARSTAKSGAKVPGKAAKPQTRKTEKMLDSKVVYEGPLFRVLQNHFIEPDGQESRRDVIRHNGSVVILAVDPGKKKKDPWVVLERQYRHAAGQYLWELPAGKLDAGEAGLDGAKRELSEETGYQAKKWSTLMTYFASPGFLGESMTVFLAEGLVAGDAHPEEDEEIELRLVKLSELLEMVDKGKIIDGKTLSSALFYARQLGLKR